MSSIIGGAYRGVVNKRLRNGLKKYPMEYEYGYTYGGLFVLGYCCFIHRYYKANNIDKLLFLARDGDILKQVYEKLFPHDTVSYLYWSRAAATKLMAGQNRLDFFKRFIFDKANQSISIKAILDSMELGIFAKESFWKEAGLSVSEDLTHKNAVKLKTFLNTHFDKVVKAYEAQSEGAKKYISGELKGCCKVCAVDIGWAGSGAVALDTLCKNVWDIDCEITGLIAGTNTPFNISADASETFLQTGKLVSYMYSQSFNRDVLKKHDPNKNYNVFWELLLSSCTKQLKGFGIDEKGNTVFKFGNADGNQKGIRRIRKGIKDFISDYIGYFGDKPFMFNISGRDAYAPVLAATGKDEKYLKAIEKRFGLVINVE